MTYVRLLKKYYKRYTHIARKYRRRGKCAFGKFESCNMCPHGKFLKKEMGRVSKLINRVTGCAKGDWHISDIGYTIRVIEAKRKGIELWKGNKL